LIHNDKKAILKIQNKSMYGILKDPGAKTEVFGSLKSEDQNIFDKMVKAVPPEKHPSESLRRWIARVAFAMENVKKV